MAYGIFYAQCEITKKNGRLPSVKEAIKLAEQRFDECGQNPCEMFHTLTDAQEALAKLKCELCPAQFWSIGAGYNAYMHALVECTEDADGELVPGDIVEFARWIRPDDED